MTLPNAETIHRVQFPNGMVVLVYETPHTQSVVLSGSLPAGSIYHAPEEGGLAALTSGGLMRGTIHRDFDQIHSTLEDIGADLDTTYGVHKMGFGGKALAEDLPTLIDVLADVIRNPTFSEDQIERLRGESLTWLKYRQQNTQWLASRTFRQMVYPKTHPYHYSARGTLETLPTITLEQIRTFHQQYYGARGMILVIVGAVRAADAVEIVARYFADWDNPHQPPVRQLPSIDLRPAGQQQMIGVPGKTQSDIIMGTLGPSRTAPDYHAANLANSILGQFGMMGRIGDVVREREGLAYYAGSQLEGGYGPGAWRFSAGVDPANVQRVIDLIRQEIHRMVTEPVSVDDLADNQSYFTGRLPLQLESNDGIAGILHSMEAYQLGLDYLATYRDTIYRLTPDDLLRAAQRYLDPDNLVISIAGPS
ncbi:MAG: insulinase family protein [Chloroflexi bacterium]|nr:MAG: insulinase family protein [Chloroflexota bacterium]